MVSEYIIGGIIAFLLALASFIIIRAAACRIGGDGIEIVIDGDEAGNNLENSIINAKLAADKYLGNCDIYIRGGNEKIVDALCRIHGIEKKP